VILKRWEFSPVVVRVAPFAVFLVLTYCQGQFGESGRFWFYFAKTVVGGWLVWEMRSLVSEARWAWSWPALGAGVAVFALWVGLDGLYPTIDEIGQRYLAPALRAVGLAAWAPKPPQQAAVWNPYLFFGENSVLAWMFVLVRIGGSALVVPPLEEVFYRSFLYRYLIKADFVSLPLGSFAAKPMLATAIIFGLTHHQWLAGILCGLCYQGLVCWRNRLGDAMTAHAITNLLLGIWVIGRGAWHFW
jgi:membrane protease YdiL (CAAX protease family)